MKKIDRESKQCILITIILGIIYAAAYLVTGQACTITYSQPKEPENIQHLLYRKQKHEQSVNKNYTSRPNSYTSR
jgi:lipoprotein